MIRRIALILALCAAAAQAVTYYCDLDSDYTDATGTDKIGNEYTGVGGLQAAIRGTGNASAMAAGDTLWVKGDGSLGRLMLIVGGKDISGWGLADEVRDNGGGGVLWSGVVCQVNVGAVNTTILVECDSAYTRTTVEANKASGINNTTAADTTTITSTACNGIVIDTGADGSAAAGHIKIFGVKSDWSEGVGSTDYCATLDAQGIATNCIVTVGTNDRWWLKNTILDSSVGDIVSGNTINDDWRFSYSIFQNAGDNGFRSNRFLRGIFTWCVFQNNTSQGMENGGAHAILNCIFRGNGGAGAQLTGAIVANSIFSGNTGYNVYLGTGTQITGCTIDGSITSHGAVMGAAANTTIRHCRISNNALYGIQLDNANDEAHEEDFNVLFNNDSGERLNIAAGANSATAASAAELGYTVWSCTITYDGGTTMDAVIVGDTIEQTGGAAWSGIVKAVTGTATDGTVSIESFGGGMPANNDAFTVNAGARGNAVVDGAFAMDATNDYSLAATAIQAGTNAAANSLDWTTTPTQTGYYTSGIPNEYSAGGGASNFINGGLVH